MTGNPTLDTMLDALTRDPSDETTLCMLWDYLTGECHVDHALNALRLLLQESADACLARKRINRVQKEFEFGKNEDALDDGLPRLIRAARERDRLRDALAHWVGERVEG